MGLYQKSNFMSFRLNPPAGGGMPESPNFMIIRRFRDKPGMTAPYDFRLLIHPDGFI